MSRIGKWKVDKVKVKVVFRLQFHATHIPLTGWDKLFVSFIPENSRKATAKTSKANVRNGTCKWADPVYETTRLLQDAQTKSYDEKLYNLVVGMGSSSSSILGEAKINLSDFSDASKPCVVALPLSGISCVSILHVTVQLLTSKTGFREFEQQRELSEREWLSTREDGCDYSCFSKVQPSADSFPLFIEKGNNTCDAADVKVEINGICSPKKTGISSTHCYLPIGSDGFSYTPGSSTTEKHDVFIAAAYELDELRSTSSFEVNGSVAEGPDRLCVCTGDNHLCGSICSTNLGSANINGKTKNPESSSEKIESSLCILNLEVDSLRNHANEIQMETKNMLENIRMEISSGERLARDVSLLKSECSAIKEDLERLKSFTSCSTCPDDLPHASAYTQPVWLNNLFHVEKKMRVIQQKTFSGHIGRDLENEFEDVLGVIQILKRAPISSQEDHFGLVTIKPSEESSRTIVSMGARISELVTQLDSCRAETDNLRHNLEEEKREKFGELEMLRGEMEMMRGDLNGRILVLNVGRHEMERRALSSEAALKRSRVNYALAVRHLQEDLECLSSQVLSLFEANENLIEQTLPMGLQRSYAEDTDRSLGGPYYGWQNDAMKMRDVKSGGLHQKSEEEELSELQSDISSAVLQETLRDADVKFRVLKEEINVGKKYEDSLVGRLRTLNELSGKMAMQNEELEVRLVSLLTDNSALREERRDLMEVIEQEQCQKRSLRGECFALTEELNAVKSEANEYNTAIQNEHDALRGRIGFMLGKQRLCFDDESSVVFLFDELLESVEDKIAGIATENKGLREESSAYAAVCAHYISKFDENAVNVLAKFDEMLAQHSRQIIRDVSDLEAVISQLAIEEDECIGILTDELARNRSSGEENRYLRDALEEKSAESTELFLLKNGVCDRLLSENSELHELLGHREELLIPLIVQNEISAAVELESTRHRCGVLDRELAQQSESLRCRPPMMSECQESLRMAFMREQYEGKLQDAATEIEERRKSEASCLEQNHRLERELTSAKRTVMLQEDDCGASSKRSVRVSALMATIDVLNKELGRMVQDNREE